MNISFDGNKNKKTYAQLWEETETVPTQNHYLFGSKKLTKMLLFCRENNITNALIDQFMALNPSEEGEERKLVSRFQKDLLKFRAYIYQHSSIRAKDVKKLEKIKKQKNESRRTPPKNRKQKRTIQFAEKNNPC